MKTVQISLNSIDKVKSFVNDITKFDYDFDLVSGRYVIDAKSIMGIFSLDLSKPIDLNIHAEDGADETIEMEAKRHPALCRFRRSIPGQADHTRRYYPGSDDCSQRLLRSARPQAPLAARRSGTEP